ncbi:MAG: threonylcarbamoyl-AMP synthase [Candidatus Dormibacteraeota bacterium]|nr:threonylcarbamoyl-AMP synthase [Candidatus Dormibacteraeota bacterium]
MPNPPTASRADILPSGEAGIKRALEFLRAGEVIGFPTDTVYGLAALAADQAAVRRIYELKGRSLSQPLVLMLADPDAVGAWAVVDERSRRYMRRWWPGPLTLVLPAAPGLRPPLVAGRPRTLGVRVPAHGPALALLRAADTGLATTSANLSGQQPAQTPLEAAWVRGVAAVIDAGRTPGGVPSTVLDLSGPEPRVLREGAVPAAELLAG